MREDFLSQLSLHGIFLCLSGLEKLIDASKSVDVLSKELAVKEQDLQIANKKADQVSLRSCDRSTRRLKPQRAALAALSLVPGIG